MCDCKTQQVYFDYSLLDGHQSNLDFDVKVPVFESEKVCELVVNKLGGNFGVIMKLIRNIIHGIKIVDREVQRDVNVESILFYSAKFNLVAVNHIIHTFKTKLLAPVLETEGDSKLCVFTHILFEYLYYADKPISFKTLVSFYRENFSYGKALKYIDTLVNLNLINQVEYPTDLVDFSHKGYREAWNNSRPDIDVLIAVKVNRNQLKMTEFTEDEVKNKIRENEEIKTDMI